ncbi:MAG: fatty acid desaturase [Woeseiaceae bacterium]
MTKPDVLDQKALASARRYMATIAWPTVILGLVAAVTYVTTVAMAIAGMLSLWVAVPIVAIVTYASYTVAHDSIHGSISGNRASMRWINKALGYMAAWVLMIPLTAHRHEHMAHHRHVNDPVHDPDFPVGRMQDSVLAAARVAIQITIGQFSHYFKHRWKKAPAKQNLVMCLEVATAILPRLAILISGYWVEGLLLFGLAWLIGVVVLLYLFAYIVHRPHEEAGRYIDTSTILLPGPLGTLLTWLWLFQNYHSIHHLFPRVPFYNYAKLYREIEEIMLAKGAPVYRVTMRGLKPVSTGLTTSMEPV